jgi:hypothetical protein
MAWIPGQIATKLTRSRSGRRSDFETFEAWIGDESGRERAHLAPIGAASGGVAPRGARGLGPGRSARRPRAVDGPLRAAAADRESPRSARLGWSDGQVSGV